MKPIIVYSCGDSNSLSTWSNVPYLFVKALERKQIKILRVNIQPHRTINRCFNTFSYYLFRKILKKNACPEYARTILHDFLIKKKLKKISNKYNDSALNLFLSYKFINPYSKSPNILWCDWTDRVVIERMGREPKWYEKASLKREDKVIHDADVVYTMFPVCKTHMEELYGREFRYLDRNVVNTVYDKDYNIDEVIAKRCISNDILFIGNHRYKGAAIELIEAYKTLKLHNPAIRLHIIGMTESELPDTTGDENITCYGYLHKDKTDERDLYYNLLLSAKLFVNPATQWGGVQQHD